MGGYGDNRDETLWIAAVPEGGSPDGGEGLFGRAFIASAREAVDDALARGWQPGRRSA